MSMQHLLHCTWDILNCTTILDSDFNKILSNCISRTGIYVYHYRIFLCRFHSNCDLIPFAVCIATEQENIPIIH